MTTLSPTDITMHVRNVLRDAAHGKGDHPNFLTAYQILDRLPDEIKGQLIAERGSAGGHGGGQPYSAASVVAKAAQLLGPEVIVEYLDTNGVSLRINGETITPGNEVCAMYRVAEPVSKDSLMGSVIFHGDIVGPFHDEWQESP